VPLDTCLLMGDLGLPFVESSTLQEKNDDLFALADRNHLVNSPLGLACLLHRDVAFDCQQKI
jgi:hypothetical protein